MHPRAGHPPSGHRGEWGAGGGLLSAGPLQACPAGVGCSLCLSITGASTPVASRGHFLEPVPRVEWDRPKLLVPKEEHLVQSPGSLCPLGLHRLQVSGTGSPRRNQQGFFSSRSKKHRGSSSPRLTLLMPLPVSQFLSAPPSRLYVAVPSRSDGCRDSRHHIHRPGGEGRREKGRACCLLTILSALIRKHPSESLLPSWGPQPRHQAHLSWESLALVGHITALQGAGRYREGAGTGTDAEDRRGAPSVPGSQARTNGQKPLSETCSLEAGGPPGLGRSNRG